MTVPLQKDALLATLVANADQRGWVGIETPGLARSTGIPEHDVVHALWDLQKRGYLRFRERHVPGGSELTRIRLTATGRKAAESGAPMPEEAVVVDPIATAIRKQQAATMAPQPPVPAVTQEVIVDMADYPLMAALPARRERLEQVARLLEESGQEDLALATLEKAHADDLYSPLEAECVRLLDLIKRGKRL